MGRLSVLSPIVGYYANCQSKKQIEVNKYI